MFSNDDILIAEKLIYQFPNQQNPAICGFDLKLKRGQAIGLLGPNGSGKSTLINLLMGLIKPQSGYIKFVSEVKPVIAWVPQDYAFYPEFTCRENLEFFVGMLVLPGSESSNRVESAINSCMLQEFSNRKAYQCSGGVKRRLNLGIALLQNPDILLLDEPTTGVDPQSRSFLLNHISDLVSRGISILYATHYMDEVSKICSEIIILDHGNVIASGALDTLLQGSGGNSFLDLESLFMHHTKRYLRE
jgi:ABC-2 type transport system ATP-binding protein